MLNKTCISKVFTKNYTIGIMTSEGNYDIFYLEKGNITDLDIRKGRKSNEHSNIIKPSIL